MQCKQGGRRNLESALEREREKREDGRQTRQMRNMRAHCLFPTNFTLGTTTSRGIFFSFLDWRSILNPHGEPARLKGRFTKPARTAEIGRSGWDLKLTIYLGAEILWGLWRCGLAPSFFIMLCWLTHRALKRNTYACFSRDTSYKGWLGSWTDSGIGQWLISLEQISSV